MMDPTMMSVAGAVAMLAILLLMQARAYHRMVRLRDEDIRRLILEKHETEERLVRLAVDHEKLADRTEEWIGRLSSGPRGRPEPEHTRVDPAIVAMASAPVRVREPEPYVPIDGDEQPPPAPRRRIYR